MDVILLEKVANLGNLGDRVIVRSGYARNFLLPKGKATLATPANVTRFEARRAELEKAAHENLSGAEGRKAASKVSACRSPPRRAAKASCSAPSAPPTSPRPPLPPVIRCSAREVRLSSGPLRTVGDHVVVVHLHTDVNIELPITITAEEQG